MHGEDLQNPNLQFEFRFSIQRRTTESTQLLERLFLMVLDCVVLQYPFLEFKRVNDAYSLHGLVQDPFCFVSEDLACNENMHSHNSSRTK